MISEKRTEKHLEEVWNARQVADFLGMGINQVYMAAANGEIPAGRAGRRWFFSKAAIMRWLCGKQEHGMPQGAT